jgi:cell wall-associated NlpC family hydrolase
MEDIKIAKAAEKLIDAKFSLGNTSKGWDCLNSLREFYSALGVDFPKSFKDYNESNYAKRWKNSSDKAKADFEEFLLTLGKPVDFHYAKRGDLMIFEGKEIPSFPAIYLGNGHILMVFDKGCKVVPLKFFKKVIKGTRRLI